MFKFVSMHMCTYNHIHYYTTDYGRVGWLVGCTLMMLFFIVPNDIVPTARLLTGKHWGLLGEDLLRHGSDLQRLQVARAQTQHVFVCFCSVKRNDRHVIERTRSDVLCLGPLP